MVVTFGGVTTPKLIEIDGESLSLRDWCKRVGLPKSTVQMRMARAGWSAAEAIMTPKQRGVPSGGWGARPPRPQGVRRPSTRTHCKRGHALAEVGTRQRGSCAQCIRESDKKRGRERSKARGRAWWRERKFGLTQEQYDAMLAAQGGVCAICGDPPSGKRPILRVDHCHVTDRVRDLLCHRCNSGIGFFLESPERMRAGAAYIERHRITVPAGLAATKS